MKHKLTKEQIEKKRIKRNATRKLKNKLDNVKLTSKNKHLERRTKKKQKKKLYKERMQQGDK